MLENLCSQTILLDAWLHVKSKNSAGGVDGISINRFEADLGSNISAIIRLIMLCVKMGVVNKKGKWKDSTKGIPQGAVISPLLANLYLHSFDQFILSRNLPYVRYADDFIILCHTKEEAGNFQYSINILRKFTCHKITTYYISTK